MVVAVQFPKIGVGVGVRALNGIGYLDMITSLGQTAAGAIAGGACTYDFNWSEGGGFEAQAGPFALATPRKILIPANGRQFSSRSAPRAADTARYSQPRVTAIPTAPVAAGSLVVGYLVARERGVRPLGGAVLTGAGAWCAQRWRRRAGTGRSVALVGVYVSSFGLSHPLGKRIGAWPAVLSAAAASGGASWLLADRRTSRRTD